MSYRIDVLVDGTWTPTRPSKGKPYTFETRDEAESVARMCYPDQTRFGWETVRVVESAAALERGTP